MWRDVDGQCPSLDGPVCRAGQKQGRTRFARTPKLFSLPTATLATRPRALSASAVPAPAIRLLPPRAALPRRRRHRDRGRRRPGVRHLHAGEQGAAAPELGALPLRCCAAGWSHVISAPDAKRVHLLVTWFGQPEWQRRLLTSSIPVAAAGGRVQQAAARRHALQPCLPQGLPGAVAVVQARLPHVPPSAAPAVIPHCQMRNSPARLAATWLPPLS